MSTSPRAELAHLKVCCVLDGRRAVLNPADPVPLPFSNVTRKLSSIPLLALLYTRPRILVSRESADSLRPFDRHLLLLSLELQIFSRIP